MQPLKHHPRVHSSDAPLCPVTSSTVVLVFTISLLLFPFAMPVIQAQQFDTIPRFVKDFAPIAFGDAKRSIEYFPSPDGRQRAIFKYTDSKSRHVSATVSIEFVQKSADRTKQATLSKPVIDTGPYLVFYSPSHQVRVDVQTSAPTNSDEEHTWVQRASNIYDKVRKHALPWPNKPLTDDPLVIGRVIAVQGKVGGMGFIEKKNFKYRDIQAGDPVLNWDVFVTQPGGRLSIQLFQNDGTATRSRAPSARLYIGENSYVSIAEFGPWMTIQQSYGWTYADILRPWRKGGLATTLAGGKKFAITRGQFILRDKDIGNAAGVNTLYFRSGATTPAQILGMWNDYTDIKLRSGQQATIINDNKPQVTSINTKIFNSNLDRYLKVKTPNPKPHRAQAAARITAASGRVYGVRPVDARPFRLHLGQTLNLHQNIETGKDAYASVELASGGAFTGQGTQVELGPESSIRFDVTQAAGIKTRVANFVGGIARWVTGKKLPNQKSSHLRINNVTIIIEGTDFMTQYDRLRGKIDLHLKSGKITVRENQTNRTVSLRPGQSITINRSNVGNPHTTPRGQYDRLARTVRSQRPIVRRDPVNPVPRQPVSPNPLPPDKSKTTFVRYHTSDRAIAMDIPRYFKREKVSTRRPLSFNHYDKTTKSYAYISIFAENATSQTLTQRHEQIITNSRKSNPGSTFYKPVHTYLDGRPAIRSSAYVFLASSKIFRYYDIYIIKTDKQFLIIQSNCPKSLAKKIRVDMLRAISSTQFAAPPG